MTAARPLKTLFGATALVVSSATTPAGALIIMDPASPSTPISNTAAPSETYADFGYWDNMLGAHTYLGNGYLLSTDHVGPLPASITIQGNSYNRIDQRRLTDPANPSVLTDLWVWKIGGPNPLPSLPTVLPILSDPVAGEKTLIIGDGRSRSGGPTFWDITYNPGADNDVWTTTANEATAEAKGFLAGTHQKQWGTNKVDDADEDIEFSATNVTRGYMVNFAQTDGTEFESQATNDDSAGPAFVKRGAQWMLTGLMHAVSVFEGQPTSPGFAGVYSYTHPDFPDQVFSSSTAISDLSEYTDQLVEFGVNVPEPVGLGTGAMLVAGLFARRPRRGRRH